MPTRRYLVVECRLHEADGESPMMARIDGPYSRYDYASNHALLWESDPLYEDSRIFICDVIERLWADPHPPTEQ